ncbi:hypothetical protein PIB30_051576 [Stylosanthes scabra]|uniref:Uncharacterized protein n=1 Tax=Stylosanthes scabra TaxID=79078 RepID=A0ABU6TJ45_9FABA|nr:hypothetical protein [Stylosanthes scabra]
MGEENESVRGRRDPSSLFTVEITCVCSVFGVRNKDVIGVGLEEERHSPRPRRGRGWDLDSTCHLHSGDPHSFTVRESACHENDPYSGIEGSVLRDAGDSFVEADPYTTTKEDDEAPLPEPGEGEHSYGGGAR